MIDRSTFVRNPMTVAMSEFNFPQSHMSPAARPLRTDGSETPLFLLPRLSGDLGYLIALAGKLRSGFPIYGLQLSDSRYASSIERLAGYHIKTIRTVQPKGPYRIVGHSLGGIVAYEMANQLRGIDEEVEFVGMIDTCAPGDSSFEELHAHLDKVDLNRTLIKSELQPSNESLAIEKACVAAARLYCPEPADISAEFFAPKDDNVAQDKTHGWRALAEGRLRVHEIPGDHASMVREPGPLAAAISRAITQGGTRCHCGYSPEIVLQANKNSEHRVICLPGAGASVTSFLPLVEALGAGTEIVGMQPRGLDGQNVPYCTVEAAATACVESVLNMSQEGPYRLLGHSFGGWIAYEMASQLVSLGHPVAPLMMLDVEPPSLPEEFPGKYGRARTLAKLIRVLELSIDRPLGIHKAKLEELDATAQIRELLKAMQEAKLLPRSAGPEHLRNMVRVFSRCLNTVYVPGCAPIAAHLFQAQEQLPLHEEDDDDISNEEAARRWGRYFECIRVWPSPGNHITLLRRPNIDFVVSRLREFWRI